MPTDRFERQAHQRKGDQAEWLATLWLQIKGYRILHRRYRGFGGEIDIVAQRGRLLAIVEVKQRLTLDACLTAVTPAQRRRIEAAAAELLGLDQNLADCTVRFDLVAIRPRRLPVHIMDAWRPDANPGFR